MPPICLLPLLLLLRLKRHVSRQTPTPRVPDSRIRHYLCTKPKKKKSKPRKSGSGLPELLNREKSWNERKRQKSLVIHTHTHTQSFLCVQGKHTPEKKRKKKWKKKKRRESAKKTQDYTQNSETSNPNGPHKKQKTTWVGPATTGICPKFRAQKNTTLEGKNTITILFFLKGSGVGYPKICYQLVVDWERITGFQLIGGMAAEEGNKS